MRKNPVSRFSMTITSCEFCGRLVRDRPGAGSVLDLVLPVLHKGIPDKQVGIQGISLDAFVGILVQ
jgi:hypothetical protein